MKIKEIITESRFVSAAQILRYVKQVHPEGEFNIDHVITDHAHWQEADVPVSNLHIFDPEQDDIYDPYNRVQDTNLHHVDRLIPNIAAILQKKPLVIDDAGYILDGNHRALAAQKAGLKMVPVWQPLKGKQGVAEGYSNDMSTEDMIVYLRQHHDKNLHPDYLNHLTNTNSKFVLKNIPLTSIRTELSGLDRAKVEQYKKMDFTQAPPIVVGSDGNILDGYHRATVAKALGIPTIKAYIGIKIKNGVAESNVFTNARMNAIKAGKDTFVVRGKTYKVTGDTTDELQAVVAEGTGLDQEAGIGIDGQSFRFKIRDLVALSGKYPVQKVDPRQFADQLAGREEDPAQSMARAQKADLQYPIIVVKRNNGGLWIADGTHRAHKAIINKLPGINAKIIPIKDMAVFSSKVKVEGDMKPVQVTGKELPGAVARLERVLLNAKQQGKQLDYDQIDLIMQKICQKHNLTGDKLHDDFVDKHHMVPDNWIKKQNSVEEAGGPDMSRRGFLGGLGALVASSGLPKVAAGALQQIFGITTPEHLVNMQYALKSRGTMLQLTSDELDKISNAIKGRPLDDWSGFRGTHKSVYGNPLIDQAYRKLTGEDMKAARVARILKDNNIDPMKFFESPSVKAVIEKIRQEWAAKWAQSGASDDPFKDPDNQPPKMDDKKALELEKKRDKAYKELKNRNSDKSTKGTAGGRMGPITLPLKPTHINGVATNAQTLPNYKQLNKE